MTAATQTKQLYTINTQPTETVRTPVAQQFIADATSFGRDALLGTPATARYRTDAEAGVTFASARTEWLARIAGEHLLDVEVKHYRTPTVGAAHGFALRTTDGAFMRSNSGRPCAFQPRAWSQLCNLLTNGLTNKPRGSGADAFGWLSPQNRAEAFEELKARSVRPEGTGREIYLRAHVDPTTGLLALRAVLSGRHSAYHFDDAALAGVLGNYVDHSAPAHVSRGIDETVGWATLDSVREDVRATIHWSNSETGAGALRFAGGCFIRLIDATIRVHGVDVVRDVTVAHAEGSTRRNHTLPRVGHSAEQRAAIAADRIAHDVEAASVEARALCTAWGKALATFPDGLEAPPAARAIASEIAADEIESLVKLSSDDRAALNGIMQNDARLQSLPWLSAAYVAAAFALLSREAHADDSKSMEENNERAQRLQEHASAFVLKGWTR